MAFLPSLHKIRICYQFVAFIFQSDIPDGHRAPVPQVHSATRSIDTQTPCRTGTNQGRNSESPASPCIRPHSISPAIPIIPGLMENSPRPSSSYDSPLGSTSGNKSDNNGILTILHLH